MGQHSVSTSSTPEVLIEEIHGNLEIKGWDRSDVLVKPNTDDDLLLDAQDDTVRISCKSNCLVRLPNRASIQVGKVHGNARIKLVENGLNCDQIAGSLVLRNVAESRIEAVHGDLLAKQVKGDLYVGEVHGNAVARDIQGNCTIKQVDGNLDLRDAEGDTTVSTEGDARVRLSLLVGENYKISAAGNLHCRVSEFSSVQVAFSSQANNIQVIQAGEKNLYRQQNHNLTLGAGKASMSLSSGGSLSFLSQETERFEMEDVEAEFEVAFAGFSEEFSQQIADQIEAQVETQLEVLNDEMEKLSMTLEGSGLSQDEMDRIMEQARVSSERATARSQENIRRAQEKLERKLAAAGRKAELRAKAAERRSQRGTGFTWPPPSETRPKTVVSDEERLVVLRMLEEKKISLEEAEQLLSALEGNGE
jgi:hypothetical protein